MLGLFCWFAVVSTLYGRRCRVFAVGGVCLAGVGAVLVRAPPPPWWAVLRWCVPPPWWGVLHWFVAPSWWGVLCWCVAPLLAGRAVLVPACRGGGVWFRLSSSVGWVAVAVVLFAWPGLVLCWCIPSLLLGRAVFVCGPPLGGVLCLRVRVLVRGVVAGWMLGLFCWLGVVSAAVRLALSGVGCLWCLPGRGWCCAGACLPSPVGACRVCACPPPWWGVLCRRVRVSVRCVVASWMLGLFCWFVVVSAAVRPALPAVGCLSCLPGRVSCCAGACPPLSWGVPCLCVAHPLVGRAVSACWGFGSWCCSRLVARLVVLVCCCLDAVPASRARVVRHPFVLARSEGPASKARAVRRPLFLFRGCCRPAARVPLFAPRFLVSARFLAVRWCLSPCAAPPPPTPPFRLLSSAPFFAPWCPARAGGFAPPPPPGGARLWRLAVSCSAFTLVASVPCGCFAPLGRLSAPSVAPPPPPPLVVFPGCWPLPLVSCCPPAAALFFLCLWPRHLLGWVSFSPLGSRPFVRSVRSALVPPPPPPGGCSWWCALPRVLFRGPAVGCGLFCAARGVLLRRAVLLCRCLAVWCAHLLCRWPSAIGVGRALFVGVARCSASPCCFVRCFVVFGAVVRCRVLWCFPCCCVVSWLWPCSLSAFLALRTCRFAPSGAAPPPPPPPPLVSVSCLLPVCVAVVCWPVLCFVVLCCCLLCCVVRSAACCVVWCRALLCSAAGVVLRCLSSCGCALLRALPCSVALCCVVLR